MCFSYGGKLCVRNESFHKKRREKGEEKHEEFSFYYHLRACCCFVSCFVRVGKIYLYDPG